MVRKEDDGRGIRVSQGSVVKNENMHKPLLLRERPYPIIIPFISFISHLFISDL